MLNQFAVLRLFERRHGREQRLVVDAHLVPFEQAQDSELVRVAERLTGHRAEAVAFGTEAPYFQRLGSETLVLGAGDIACAHQPDEHLELARIEPMVGVLRRLIQHYCLTPAAD